MNMLFNSPESYRGAYQSKFGSGVTGSRGGTKGDVVPKGFRAGQVQQFTPEALQLYQQLFSQLNPESDLFRLAEGDEDLFNQIEAPAMRQFNELQGGLASRFSGMGMGARRSSGFQNMSNAAASNFAQDLASKRSDLSRQAMRDLFDMSHMLMNEKPFERILSGKRQKEPGFMSQLGSNFAQSAGRSLGQLF